jgi:hypothetical protein
MIAQLTFDLPNEQSAFLAAAHGADLMQALSEADGELRSMLKHMEDIPDAVARRLEGVRSTLNEALQMVRYE